MPWFGSSPVNCSRFIGVPFEFIQWIFCHEKQLKEFVLKTSFGRRARGFICKALCSKAVGVGVYLCVLMFLVVNGLA